MFKTIFLSVILLSVLSFCISTAVAQPPTWTIDLLDKEKKPEKFSERKLGSEKMAEKKFTWIRHLFQNNFTRYNYYFNANNKINTVLERAKLDQKDDYTKLIGYYPFTLEKTASQKTELDSVIYKSTAGILLHDLRNDWIDNMYLLMGKAYFLRKDFDSAAATFQFIQYNLFPRKKDEDGNRVIGASEDASNSKISIANKEKQNILQKTTALPPSRNDALVWLARTLIEQNELGEAAGLINTLREDPNLPKRLVDDLNEMNGYWYYKQNIYDSAAVYLEKALTNIEFKEDKARTEFLLAQLYEQNKQFGKATSFYEKASLHTVNPLMNIYAQLNNAKMSKGNNQEDLFTGIENLMRLTKKDNFENYRDLLYYSAGELAILKPDTNQSVIFFNKSIHYNENNIVIKNKAFLQLANIAYKRKEYEDAFRFYDSLQSGDTTLNETLKEIQDRRNYLSKIVEKLKIINREDSLQRIAALPKAEKEAFVKKLSKRLRKEKGLKETENLTDGPDQAITFAKDNNEPIDLFANNSKNSTDWYFYNASKKSKGFADFKRKWGVRPNADNWRRKAAINALTVPKLQDDAPQLGNMNPDDLDTPPADDISKTGNSKSGKKTGQPGGIANETNDASQAEDISFEGLMSGLPLTEEKLTASKNLVAVNLFELGKIFQEDVEDYEEAIKTYDQSLERFPDSMYNGELYLGFYFCYTKLGNKYKAVYYKNLLAAKFPDSKSNTKVANPVAANPNEKNPEVTKRYQDIYTLFIEGKFEEAVTEKKKADSLHGNNYWSPQLLYIEAVYQVKQKNDSVATDVLNNIISLYPSSPLKIKAERMIDVLARRSEIEKYLTDLQVTRLNEDDVIQPQRVVMIRDDANLIKSTNTYDSLQALAKKTDTSKNVQRDAAIVKPADTVAKIIAPVISGPYVFNTAVPHSVLMLLDKVDGTYVNECKNALSRYAGEYFRSAALTVLKDAIDKDFSYISFESFASAEEAMQFLYKVKKAAPDEVSWLPASKYSFLLIDSDNLQRLKTTKDITGYKALLNKQYPGQFK